MIVADVIIGNPCPNTGKKYKPPGTSSNHNNPDNKVPDNGNFPEIKAANKLVKPPKMYDSIMQAYDIYVVYSHFRIYPMYLIEFY